jgi:ERCC4-type nuclease
MIFIDNRIGSRELYDVLPPRLPRQLTTLQYGDVAWQGNGPNGPGTAFVGVERKRLRDFLSSMESGRLTGHQLIGMSHHYHYTTVVIEGIWKAGADGMVEVPGPRRKGKVQWVPLELGSRRFPVSVLDNFSTSLSHILGITVVYTSSKERTCEWIANTYRWWTVKKWEQHRSCSRKQVCAMPVLPNGSKQSLVARVLVEFEGVGPDKALKIAGKVNESGEGLAGLCKSTLMEIEGIGKTTTDVIMAQLNELLWGPRCAWCGERHAGGPENCKR